MTEKSFKQCTLCKYNWITRDDLLNDTSVSFVGYQVNVDELLLGFFLFNHKCRTTIAIPVSNFQDLYTGLVHEENKMGSAECPGYCLHKNELRQCNANCKLGWVRELMQIIRHPNKRAEAMMDSQASGSKC